ncbi:glycoside hydrolase family 32 protein [Ruminococcus sp. AF25-17]|nr:glycoside hydrolase family 32 protein [Ruminococcus sp. AF25-17]
MIKRQKYHLEPDRGLLNDPNGLVFYKDMYHVFFQWNRFEKNHSYKEWGHFTSKDLLHWNWEGSALLPDQFYEQNGVYSGSALIKDGQLRLFYTGNNKSGGVRKSSQCLAVTEDGKTFQKKGIVLSTPTEFTEHFRDPKVWQDGDNYYMVIGAQMKNGRGSVALCSSKDAENWKFELVLAKSKEYEMVECPDYFQVDGQGILLYCPQHRDNERDSSLCSFSAYKEFDFNDIVSGKIEDSNVQNLDEGRKKMDQGFDFYAPQTFTSLDGRKILLAWMSRMEEEEEKLFGEGESSIHCMTLPRELSYRNGELCQLPVRELEKKLCIHKISEQEIQSGEIILKNRVYCAKLSNLQNETSFKIEFQSGEVILEYKKVEKIISVKRKNWVTKDYDESGEVILEYKKVEKIISVKRKNWVTKDYDERTCKIDSLETIECWSDISSMEIFVNQGSKVFSMRMFTEEENGKVKISGFMKERVMEMYDLMGEGEEKNE